MPEPEGRRLRLIAARELLESGVSIMDSRKTIVVAEPRSFCAGVRRAIDIVEVVLERFGAPIYVRNQIVHNHHVVAELEQRGVMFVSATDRLPRGAVCVLSAHGVSPAVCAEAAERELTVIDATCTLVARVHQEVEDTYGEAPDRTIVISTVEELAEVELPIDAPVSYRTQTTLSLDETREVVEAMEQRSTDLRGTDTDDICYASQNGQNAVKALARRTDLVLVPGSSNSSNTMRMVAVARQAGVRSHLVPNITDLDEQWLEGVESIGLSAGASAPDFLVDQLADVGFDRIEVERTGSEEDIVFGLASVPAVSPERRQQRNRRGRTDVPRTLIIGLGRAGLGLHLPVLRKLRAHQSHQELFDLEPVVAVDPRMRDRSFGPDLLVVGSLAEACDLLDSDRTVVHVCTPPVVRVALLRQLVVLGFRQIIVEKPLTTSIAELVDIQQLAHTWQLRLTVVAPWLASSLTTRLTELVRDGQLGALLSLIHI